MTTDKIKEFVELIARMKTEEEQDMTSEDAFMTLNDLIESARELIKTKSKYPAREKAIVRALKDFAKIAEISKPNCGDKLHSIIQATQEKHAKTLDSI